MDIVPASAFELSHRATLKRRILTSLAEAHSRSALLASRSAQALAAHAARVAEEEVQAQRAGTPVVEQPPSPHCAEQSAASSARYRSALVALEHHLRQHQVAQLQVRVELEQQKHARLSAALAASAASSAAAVSCGPKRAAFASFASVHAAHTSARALFAAKLRRDEAMGAKRCFIFR